MVDSMLKEKLTYLFHMLDVSQNQQLDVKDFELVAEQVTKHLGNSKLEKRKKAAVFRRSRDFFKRVQTAMGLTKDSIDLQDWLGYFENHVLGDENKQSLNEVVRYLLSFFFGVFDDNRDGFFSIKEYENIFETFGISKSQSQGAFNKMDLNQDGILSRYEILMSVEMFITSTDPDEPGNQIFGDWS
jgi:Ca2+-binding EF-hand superfamily protein